jgi:hypothetical protein
MTSRHLSAYAVLAVLGPACVVACAADPGDAPKGLGGASSTVSVSVHTTTSSSTNTGNYGSSATSNNTGVQTSVNTGVGSTSGSVGTTVSSSSSTSSTTPPCTTCTLMIAYEAEGMAMGGTSVAFKLQVTNTGTGSQDLSQVTIRYYFTAEGASGLTGQINSAGITLTSSPYFEDVTKNISQAFNALSPTTATADSYVELSFAAGTPMLPASSPLTIDSQFHSGNYSTTFNQTNDYSYDGTATSAFKASSTITAYVAGTLVYGTEPM